MASSQVRWEIMDNRDRDGDNDALKDEMFILMWTPDVTMKQTTPQCSKILYKFQTFPNNVLLICVIMSIFYQDRYSNK